MSSLPVDLADTLVTAGATVAMELDINPGTVQLDTAWTPGGPLRRGYPGQTRPPDQCQAGWIRDFVTVLAVGWRRVYRHVFVAVGRVEPWRSTIGWGSRRPAGQPG